VRAPFVQPTLAWFSDAQWMAETRNGAEAAFDAFIETYGRKYEKAVECLIKDRDTLLAFYGNSVRFPLQEPR